MVICPSLAPSYVPARWFSRSNGRSPGAAALVSLSLLAGSYFREADASRLGTDADGRPVDARDLFDPLLLAQMIRSI